MPRTTSTTALSDNPQVRALGVVRLSRMRDESTSPERQRATIVKLAGLDDGALEDSPTFPASGRDATVVGLATDLSVSGAVSPFEREGLGPWLTDNPPQPWNVLYAWKLDRISRSALDTLTLVEWLKERGKHLVTSDGIDTRTTMGEVFVQLAAIFAELERSFIKERTADSRAELKAQGRWGGEAVHYGLKAVPHEGGGYKLDLDPVGVEWINQAADWVLEGVSVAEASRRLQAKNVLAPRDRQRQIRDQPLKGDEWSDSTLMQILKSKTLLGWTVSKGEPDSKVMKSPPIMTALKYQRLQLALERNAKPQSRPAKSSSAPLSGVALCLECLEPLWHRGQYMPAGKSRMKNSKTYRYYYCKTKGHTKSIPADQLEELSTASFLATYADVEVTEPVAIPASDPSELIAEAELAVQNLAQQLAQAKTATMIRIISSELELWESKLAELEAIPRTSGGIEHVPTGRTWRQELDSLDDEGRRLLWSRVGFRFAARVGDDFNFGIQPPAMTQLWETFNDSQKDAARKVISENPNGFDLAAFLDHLPDILHHQTVVVPDDEPSPFQLTQRN